MKNWIAFLGMLWVPAAALAQQDSRLPAAPRLADETPALPEPLLPAPWGTGYPLSRTMLDRHSSFGLSILGRIGVPGDGSIANNADTVYSDIFDVGFGVSVEADLMVKPWPDFEVGGYLSVGYDRFSGRSTSLLDPFTGDTLDIKPDSLEITTAIVGAKILSWFGPHFFWEGRIGLGVIHYQSVNADFTLNGVDNPDQQLFKESTRAIFEIGGRIGWGTERTTFDLGLGWRLAGAPGKGKDAGTFLDLNPDLFDYLIVELGVTFRF